MAFWKAGFAGDEEEKSLEVSIMKEVIPSKQVKTVFAEGAFVEGKLAFETDVQIDGHVRGSITAHNLLVVGKNGKLEAELDVGDLIVEGLVLGRVKAKGHVHIASTGKLLGDISCGSFSVERGGFFRGECVMELPEELKNISA
ncbi:MAG: polymer-forming cytoskeletal protein [Deltaproteobacteria bacterium]|nr:polymer-forming cytoskeletal protein [Deltaproteobacteria bacterium]MCX7953390.1 polymer-forming cytoskeletal protein [Deltaproteobacteria bacterium]